MQIGSNIKYITDEAGNITAVEHYDGEALLYTESYTYDSEGNVTEVTIINPETL